MRAVLFWALALLPAVARLAAAQASLRFHGDGALRIIQLTDLHVGEGPPDARTLHVRLVSALLFLEAPLQRGSLPPEECRQRAHQDLIAVAAVILSRAFWIPLTRSAAGPSYASAATRLPACGLLNHTLLMHQGLRQPSTAQR